MPVNVKRIYDPIAETDGYRVLIDRLWPRGIKKDGAHIDKWLKDVAPTTALRKWFDHDPEKWPSFLLKYQAEINGSLALEELRSDILAHKTVTFLYAARDQQHNHALALRQIISNAPGQSFNDNASETGIGQ
jgi:uncharacterized protein YeaO (DUF488 family)